MNLTDWVAGLERPGSFVAVTNTGADIAEAKVLTDLGWRGLVLTPEPAVTVSLRGSLPMGQAVACTALLTLEARKLSLWPGPDGKPHLVATVHPSELYELLEALPQPRFLSVSLGAGSLAVFAGAQDWINAAAARVTVPEDELEAAREWFGAWHALETLEPLAVAGVRP